jgi:hypothetical protein
VNAALEKALATYLGAQLAEARPALRVLAATTDGTAPGPEVAFVIAKVGEMKHEVGGLYTATVMLYVDTPRVETAADASHHDATVAMVRDAFEISPDAPPEDQAEYAAALVQLAAAVQEKGWIYSGHFILDVGSASSPTDWVHILTLVMGVRQ